MDDQLLLLGQLQREFLTQEPPKSVLGRLGLSIWSGEPDQMESRRRGTQRACRWLRQCTTASSQQRVSAAYAGMRWSEIAGLQWIRTYLDDDPRIEIYVPAGRQCDQG